MSGARGERTTFEVDGEVFQAVYDSPASLPGEHSWVTPDEDVREIERVLDIPEGSIGAPLWLSGDSRACARCGRETSWLDIVTSALAQVHRRDLLVKVVLGDRKYVNVEAPAAIADLRCHGCQAPIPDLRSFKCHNWAYAIGKIERVLVESSKRA